MLKSFKEVNLGNIILSVSFFFLGLLCHCHTLSLPVFVFLVYSKALFSLNGFVKNLFVPSEFIAWRKVEILKKKCKLF